MIGNLNTIIRSISDEELEFVDDNAYKRYRNKLKNPEKYLEMIDNIHDKIMLSQYYHLDEYLKKYVEEILNDLTLYELKKYLKLKQQNSIIDSSLNFKILAEKYSFLDNSMLFITKNLYLQNIILSFNDEKLCLFKLVYNEMYKSFSDPLPFLIRFLELIDSNDSFRLPHEEKHLSANNFVIKWFESYSKYIKINLSNQIKIRELIYKAFQITEIKIGSTEKNIFKKSFKRDITNNDKNKIDIISKICIERRSEVIIKIMYFLVKNKNHINDPFLNYIIDIWEEDDLNKLNLNLQKIEEEIKKEYKLISLKQYVFDYILNEYKKSLLNINDCIKIPNAQHQNLYKAPIEFNIIVRSIAAYQKIEIDNYYEYWNSNFVKSLFNCCSYIRNDNFATANIKHVIFGFNSFEDVGLLAMASFDLDSTPKSEDLYYKLWLTRTFPMLPNELINSTRGLYNEMVFDLFKQTDNKKIQPSYLICFEEYKDYDKTLEEFPDEIEYIMNKKKEQEHTFNESIKCSKNYNNLPIIIINREEMIENEMNKVEQKLNSFVKQPSDKLIQEIIESFMNNRTSVQGNRTLTQKYVSYYKLLNIIINMLCAIEQSNVNNKINLCNVIIKSLENELYKLNLDSNKIADNNNRNIKTASKTILKLIIDEIKQIVDNDLSIKKEELFVDISDNVEKHKLV